MWKCPKCGEQVDATFEVCWNCGTGKDGTEDPSFDRAEEEVADDHSAQVQFKEAITARPAPPPKPPREWKLIVTTTPSVEGKQIKRYCGLVTGEAILGANFFKDLLAGLTDIFGGRASAYEGELRTARDIALDEMEQAAADLGANAVVGAKLDYETVGSQGSMLMVSACGTAVVVE